MKGAKDMKSMDFTNYNIADIPNEDLQNISELEKSLSKKINKDVVLIAYQHTEKAES
jgi:hypothetical protein